MKPNADALKAIMREAGLTRLQTADMLHVSLDTLHSWLKPDTSKSANPCPLWAVELLGFKIASQKKEKAETKRKQTRRD